GKGYRVIGLWGKVRGELGEVLERWFGAETVGKGGLVFGGYGDWAFKVFTVFVVILLGFPGPSDGLRLHPTVFFSSGSGLTADSSVLTLTLAFLDFGLDFAQSFPFHAQFCHFGLKEEKESSDGGWSNYVPNDEWKSLELKKINDSNTIRGNQECIGEYELMIDDNDFEYTCDYLLSKDATFVVDKEKERLEEKMYKLLGMPYERIASIE
ncbi:hypothetical protein Tco_0180359, partial [Tanacetum coccineum]